MPAHNACNERIKRQYFTYLKEAKRYSEATVDAVAAALSRFEADTKHRDFKSFHIEQAIAFKRRLAEQRSLATGGNLSKSTMLGTLSQLKAFFQWLAGQPGYRSRMRYSDADYFNLSEKETRIATARREREGPTVEQVHHVLSKMSAETEIGLRNRALVAFTLLTGARDRALASLKLKHVDLRCGSVYQDARDVKTKASKSFTTYFFPVGGEALRIVTEWVALLESKGWTDDDPLFPSTHLAQGPDHRFHPAGLKRSHWANAGPIRAIFREAFQAAGLPYFNPHSFRRTLAMLGQTLCHTAEQFKAWSQNLGHEGVLTTFSSYGTVATRRQAEIIKNIGEGSEGTAFHATAIAEAVAQRLMSRGGIG